MITGLENMKVIKILVVACSILYSCFCFSGSYNCTGKVENLFVTRNGDVELYSTEIYGSNIGRKVCNTTSAWKNVSADTCRVWISIMLAQVAQKKPLKVYYLTDDAANCTSLPAFENAPPPWGVSEN